MFDMEIKIINKKIIAVHKNGVEVYLPGSVYFS